MIFRMALKVKYKGILTRNHPASPDERPVERSPSLVAKHCHCIYFVTTASLHLPLTSFGSPTGPGMGSPNPSRLGAASPPNASGLEAAFNWTRIATLCDLKWGSPAGQGSRPPILHDLSRPPPGQKTFQKRGAGHTPGLLWAVRKSVCHSADPKCYLDSVWGPPKSVTIWGDSRNL